jgi:tryptophan synthase beta chain
VLHQSVIGQEAVDQLALVETGGADYVFGCAGGGSNLAGLAFPFIRELIHGRSNPKIIAAEPSACPSITQGEYRYDHGDVAGLTPLLKMHTLGMDFVPDPIHAGGLRYHGMSPALSHTVELGYVDGVAIEQKDAFAAGVLFARTQGIVPAPESTHAIAAAVDRVRDSDTEEVIVIGLSGHGQLDLPAYKAYLDGDM